MSCSIPVNTYPTLKAYIDSHVADILQYVGEPDYDRQQLFNILIENTTDSFPGPDEHHFLDPYVAYANCVVRDYLQTMAGTQASSGPQLVEVVSVDPQTAASGLIASNSYAIPNLYTLRSLEDFYVALWVAEGKNAYSPYDRQKAEQLLLDLLNSEIAMIVDTLENSTLYQGKYFAGELGRLAQADPSNPPVYSDIWSALAVITEAHTLFQTGTSPELEEIYGYIAAYQFAQAAEANGGILPDYAYDNYNPDLKVEDFIKQYGDEKKLRGDWKQLVDDILLVKAFSESSELAKSIPAPDAPLEEWAAYVNQLTESYLVWRDTYDASWDPQVGALLYASTIAMTDETADNYEAAITWDIMRKVVYDPDWSPAEEEQLLQALLVQLNLLPASIMNVNVYFVRQGLLQYYLLMRNFHDWRVQMKAVVDEVETRLMNQDTPNEQFAKVLGKTLGNMLMAGSLVLSVLYEPFDWIMSIIDIARGDFSGALFNLLPLIPGAVAKLGRLALRTGGVALDLAVDAWNRLNKANEALKQLDEAIDIAKQGDYAAVNSFTRPKPGDRLITLAPNSVLPGQMIQQYGFGDMNSFELNVAKQPFTQQVTVPNLPWWEIDRWIYRLKPGSQIELPVELASVNEAIPLNGTNRYRSGPVVGVAVGQTEITTRGFWGWNVDYGVSSGQIFATTRYRGEYILTHYHPDGTSFSLADIRMSVGNADNLVELRAFGRNGELYIWSLTDDTRSMLRARGPDYMRSVANGLPEKLPNLNKYKPGSATQIKIVSRASIGGVITPVPLEFDYVVQKLF